MKALTASKRIDQQPSTGTKRRLRVTKTARPEALCCAKTSRRPLGCHD